MLNKQQCKHSCYDNLLVGHGDQGHQLHQVGQEYPEKNIY